MSIAASDMLTVLGQKFKSSLSIGSMSNSPRGSVDNLYTGVDDSPGGSVLKRIMTENEHEDDDYPLHPTNPKLKVRQMIPDYIGLTKMYLSDMGLKSLPEEFEQLISLETLALDLNKFRTIPKPVSRLRNLKCLYINDNKVTEVSNCL